MRRTVCLINPVHETLRIVESKNLEYRLSARSRYAQDVSDVKKAPIDAPVVTAVCNERTPSRVIHHKIVLRMKTKRITPLDRNRVLLPMYRLRAGRLGFILEIGIRLLGVWLNTIQLDRPTVLGYRQSGRGSAGGGTG